MFQRLPHTEPCGVLEPLVIENNRSMQGVGTKMGTVSPSNLWLLSRANVGTSSQHGTYKPTKPARAGQPTWVFDTGAAWLARRPIRQESATRSATLAHVALVAPTATCVATGGSSALQSEPRQECNSKVRPQIGRESCPRV